jgi:hypothetical protein
MLNDNQFLRVEIIGDEMIFQLVVNPWIIPRPDAAPDWFVTAQTLRITQAIPAEYLTGTSAELAEIIDAAICEIFKGLRKYETKQIL